MPHTDTCYRHLIPICDTDTGYRYLGRLLQVIPVDHQPLEADKTTENIKYMAVSYLVWLRASMRAVCMLDHERARKGWRMARERK